MAAGLGFKTFNTGDVLTAADTNGYLMQGVWVFASAAARTSAVTSPQEGNVSFLKDTNSLEIYDGAAWVAYGAGDITGVTAGTGISGGGTSGDVTITNSMATAIDAKGDLIVGTGADTFSRLAVGATDGHVLKVKASTSTGLEWGAVSATASFSGCSLLNSSSYTISNATNTNLTFNTELFDTDGFHSTSTNTDRITIPSGKDGKYLITAAVAFDSNATGERSMRLMKNGSTTDDNNRVWAGFGSSAGNTTMTIARIVSAVAGDYFTLRVYQSSGGDRTIVAGSGYEGWTHFDATYLGA